MKLFLICSKSFYKDIPSYLKALEKKHEIVFPNSYDNPREEKESFDRGEQAHRDFKRKAFERSRKVINDVDAVLCFNFEKGGRKNYIGGATFLELYDAYMANKKIFLWNDIPEGILYDEIHGFAPVIIHGDLRLIK